MATNGITTGKKNIGGKKEDYLQEKELEAYVDNINEIDTLVLYRLSLEGGGRISSQLLMGTNTAKRLSLSSSLGFELHEHVRTES